MTNRPPPRPLAPDDPRAQCDAATPEEMELVTALLQLADALRVICAGTVAARRPTSGEWAHLGEVLGKAAAMCRQQSRQTP